MEHATAEELMAGLDEILRSPVTEGTLEMIVRRPCVDEREVLDRGTLEPDEGLVGDRWNQRETPNPDTQLTLMNARTIDLIAGSRERWPLAGDQLYVDLDLSLENLPAGTRLAVGEAVVEVTAEPHTGCAKFSARFGTPAIAFVNKPPGRELRLRGINTRIVTPGTVRVGDAITKL